MIVCGSCVTDYHSTSREQRNIAEQCARLLHWQTCASWAERPESSVAADLCLCLCLCLCLRVFVSVRLLPRQLCKWSGKMGTERLESYVAAYLCLCLFVFVCLCLWDSAVVQVERKDGHREAWELSTPRLPQLCIHANTQPWKFCQTPAL